MKDRGGFVKIKRKWRIVQVTFGGEIYRTEQYRSSMEMRRGGTSPAKLCGMKGENDIKVRGLFSGPRRKQKG